MTRASGSGDNPLRAVAMASLGCAARGGVATTSSSSRVGTSGPRGEIGTSAPTRKAVTLGNAPCFRFRRVSLRTHTKRDGSAGDARGTLTLKAGADDVGHLDAQDEASRDVSGDAPETFVSDSGTVKASSPPSSSAAHPDSTGNAPSAPATRASAEPLLEESERATIDAPGEEPEIRAAWSFEDVSVASPAAFKRSWRNLPSRYRVILGTTLAFVLCNMDKVNISVAIIPMAKEMGWSVGQAGVLQSAFFYGFAVSQLPGGYLATKVGGARMLPLGVLVWSVATAAAPFCADDPNALFFTRVLVGLGEGVSPSAATDVIARSVPVNERSRAVAFVFNGFNVGSVIGLSVAPLIIENFGWRSVFVAFGGLGILWVAWVGLGIYPRGGAFPAHESFDANARALRSASLAPVEGLTGQRGAAEAEKNPQKTDDREDSKVPWRAIASSTPVRALAYVHFCNNWGFYVLLAWLPSYFTQEIGVTLTNASLFTLLPPLANIAVASAVGPLADDALKRGVNVTTVRKVAQTIALCGPASFMALASFQGDDESGLVTVALLTVGLSLSSFSYAGLYCNHQDMSPKYASILLGMTNTIGALPGVIGVPLTGYLLQRTENWELSMFLPAIVLYFSGAAVFAKYGDGEKQSWG